MNYNEDCFYCTKNNNLTDIMIKICDLDASTLYLFKEQTYRGRCLVAYKEHKSEIFHLTDEERSLLMKDVARTANAIDQAFSPNKMNYGAYADKMTHLHYHIVPKYEGGPSWGGTFEIMPNPKVLLTDEEYAQIIEKIKENL